MYCIAERKQYKEIQRVIIMDSLVTALAILYLVYTWSSVKV